MEHKLLGDKNNLLFLLVVAGLLSLCGFHQYMEEGISPGIKLYCKKLGFACFKDICPMSEAVVGFPCALQGHYCNKEISQTYS